MDAFNIIGLDKDYQIVSLLRPSNLQWNRKYHEPGNFSIQLPLSQYSQDIRYIYTKDRPEMGRVVQQNYMAQLGYKYMQLSGYFEENELNRHVVYPKGSSNIKNFPTWIEQSGAAENVAYAFFDGFKDISIGTIVSSLGIQRAESLGRGKRAIHTRNGEYLGNKIYDILKPSGMSYRVLYDFVNSQKTFEVWSGLDRTEANTQKNNPIIFSTKYGNIKNPNILISEENYKNACIVTNEQVSGNESSYISRAVFGGAEDNGRYSMLFLQSTLNRSEYSGSALTAALDDEASNALEETIRIINVEFDALEGSYDYMKDFDIGDKCTLEIPEMHLSADARLIGCYEVMKSGTWSMSMEFGTPIIKGGMY